MIFHCGFARAAAVLHSTFTVPKQGCKRLTKISSTWKEKLNRFRGFFGDLPSQMAAEFDPDNKTFRTRAPSITDTFPKWKRSEKQAYINKFSKDSCLGDNWMNSRNSEIKALHVQLQGVHKGSRKYFISNQQQFFESFKEKSTYIKRTLKNCPWGDWRKASKYFVRIWP